MEGWRVENMAGMDGAMSPEGKRECTTARRGTVIRADHCPARESNKD